MFVYNTAYSIALETLEVTVLLLVWKITILKYEGL